MAGIAEGRLREERRSWRKDHPIGFVARPRSKADGSTDLLNWDVVIPGKKDTMWEGCEFNLTMEFSSDYPATAPVVKFVSRSVLRVGNTWSRRWRRRDATPSRRRRRGRERVCAPRE